jgi:hypothetical protein
MSRRGVAVLDLLATALAVLAAYVMHAGGLIIWVADLRIRLRTPTRTLLWMGAVLLVRYVLYRRLPPFGMTRADWVRLLLAPAGLDQFRVHAAPGVWRRAAWAAAGIALALGVMMHDQVGHPYSVRDHGDPLFSMWRIGWVLHQLVTDPAHLFDGNIFYPELLTLTLSDPIILPAVTAAPLLALGVPMVVAYNVLFFSSLWISGIATYLLVERLTGSAPAAFIAGLVYACYPYRLDHLSHLELQITQWMPLGLLALHLFVATGRWPYVFALAFAGVAQLYSSMYYAVFFLIYATAIGGGLLIVHRPPIRKLVLPAAAAALTAILAVLPLGRAFLAVQPLKGDRPIDEVKYYSATLSDYFRAPRASALWGERTPSPEPERALFPGAAPLSLAVIGIAPPLAAVRVVYVAGLLLSVDGSRGFNGVIYPYLHRWLTPVRGLRVPARFGALVGLSLAILAGFGARRVLGWCGSPRRLQVAFLALTAAVMADGWPEFSVKPVWTEPPAIYDHLKDRRDVVLAELPVTETVHLNTPYMYFSLWHWTPMVNGYSGFFPPSYRALAPELIAFPRGDTADALRRHGVTHVTINCGLGYANCEETASLMSQSTELRLVADTLWQGASVQLYELVER